MKKETVILLVLVLFIISCVPKPEPYVLDDRHETAEEITQEMAQIEAQAKEQAREKFAEDQQKVQEQQQEAQAAANVTPQMVVQTEQQKAGVALGLYPNYFMDGDAFKSNFITVVGDEAPSSYVVAVSNLMARTPGNKPTGFSMLASEISDLSRYNAVVAGTACNNEVVAKLLGNPQPCDSADLPAGKGLIRIYESQNGNIVLLAAGKTDAQVLSAVNLIGTDQFISVTADEMCAQGTTLLQC